MKQHSLLYIDNFVLVGEMGVSDAVLQDYVILSGCNVGHVLEAKLI